KQAKENYKTFQRLTNFSTPAYEWALFHFVGFHLGRRSHADRKASYDSQRSTGFLGLCLCDQRLGNLLQAKEHCQRALKYDSKDAIGHFVLGNVYRDLYNQANGNGINRCDFLVSARDN